MANYQQADQGVINFLKYSANFIFYRFGLEVKKKKMMIKQHLTFV
jgi:hypothetical protein